MFVVLTSSAVGRQPGRQAALFQVHFMPAFSSCCLPLCGGSRRIFRFEFMRGKRNEVHLAAAPLLRYPALPSLCLLVASLVHFTFHLTHSTRRCFVDTAQAAGLPPSPPPAHLQYRTAMSFAVFRHLRL